MSKNNGSKKKASVRTNDLKPKKINESYNPKVNRRSPGGGVGTGHYKSSQK